jgi:hypothetical protein
MQQADGRPARKGERMATGIQVVVDCHDPAALSQFWAEALGYRLQPPPEGHESWPEFLNSIGVPESEWNAASAAVDPDGVGPRFYFQRVPEAKTVKNRIHVDLNVGGDPWTDPLERRQRIDAEVERLHRLGASVAWRTDTEHEYFVTMRDPEGNEFCVQ